MYTDKRPAKYLAVLLTLLVPLVVVAALIWIAASILFRSLILIIAWLAWSWQGKDLLVIYSDSPLWKSYFEAGLLPLISNRAIVLNWSNRSKWPPISLKAILFSQFKGEKDFNPMILRISPLRLPKTIRFYRAFHDSKHGKQESLMKVEGELASMIDQPIELTPYHPRPSA